MRCKPPLAKQDVREVLTKIRQYNNIVTSTTGIGVVNGVSYLKLSNAIEHVQAMKETSVQITGVKLPEPNESAKITGVYI